MSRVALAALLACAVLAAVAWRVVAQGGSSDGSDGSAAGIESIGRPGTGDGEFRDPRGIAVSDRGLAVLDRTGRMQIFDPRGAWVRSFAVVPGDVRRGMPTGAAWLPDGTIAVAHTHESRIVVFSETGAVVRSFGEYGTAPGQFLYPQRIALDAAGNFVVAEYGFERTNRVQVLRPDGTVVRAFGDGTEAGGGLGRPMGAVPLPDGRILVADQKAGLVAFTADGQPLGRFGPPLAEGALVRGVCIADDGDVYVVDGGRSELLRLAPDGSIRGILGSPVATTADPADPEGAEPGASVGASTGPFREPWDVAWHRGRVYVADMGNHRVARIDPEAVHWRRP